jgi:hypothetical protein
MSDEKLESSSVQCRGGSATVTATPAMRNAVLARTGNFFVRVAINFAGLKGLFFIGESPFSFLVAAFM